MTPQERLTLAALMHDLPALLTQAGIRPAPDAQAVLNLARLDDPALAAIVATAEALTLSEPDHRALVSDQPLISIFSQVELRTAVEAPVYRVPTPLPATDAASIDTLFPSPEYDPSLRSAHLRSFAAELARLGASVGVLDADRLYTHLLALMQRWVWCLPAHTADVSLFDHARLTSAIAACLYRFHAADLSIEAITAAKDDDRFCLIVGDLSGIQSYIFDIATIGAGGVARRLRARSFYLSALSDVLTHQIAMHFGVPLGNVIMASGGKFYVLVASQPDIDAEIGMLRRRIDLWFRAQANGEIAVNLAHYSFPGEFFQVTTDRQVGFGEVLGVLSRQLARQKQQRGRSILVADGQWQADAFVIERDFWGRGVCASCRKHPADATGGLCGQCERDVQIGRQLVRARYIAFYRDEHAGEFPMPLGCSIRVLERNDLAQAGQPYLVVKLNDPEIHELAHLAGSFRYLANYVPVDAYGVQQSFEDIAARAAGRPMLGYLKADVDYLGILFAEGLRRDQGRGYDTAAHIAMLSRELDLFFSGWMQHTLSQIADYQAFYTIFSGGDDLFLVGPWDRAASLAQIVRNRFAGFVGHNRDVTLSAGILFTKDRYPISRASEDAEQQLEHSKERVGSDGLSRNQLTLLGDTLKWDDLPFVLSQIETLQKFMMSSAFLYALVEYGTMYKHWQSHQEVASLRYKPLFAYNIARNLRKGDPELYRWADNVLQSFNSTQTNHTMNFLALIATYLLFSRRERKPE